MGYILMVDDDSIFSDYIVNALMDEGHIVARCENGLEALSALNFRLPSVMILDCNMPEMNGIELLRKMRLDERLFRIPVLMLTARSSQSDENIGRYEGATDYLAKPAVLEEVLHKVESLLARAANAASIGETFGETPSDTAQVKRKLI